METWESATPATSAMTARSERPHETPAGDAPPPDIAAGAQGAPSEREEDTTSGAKMDEADELGEGVLDAVTTDGGCAEVALGADVAESSAPAPDCDGEEEAPVERDAVGVDDADGVTRLEGVWELLIVLLPVGDAVEVRDAGEEEALLEREGKPLPKPLKVPAADVVGSTADSVAAEEGVRDTTLGETEVISDDD